MEWLKGSQDSCGVLSGNSDLLFRPYRKRRVSSRDDRGILWFFSSCSKTCGVSIELLPETQGASHVALGYSSLHLGCEEERGIALESRQEKRASRCVEGRIFRLFSSCGSKSWVPLTCDGDLRELLMGAYRMSGILWSWEGPLGTPLGSELWKRASSRVDPVNLRVPLLF